MGAHNSTRAGGGRWVAAALCLVLLVLPACDPPPPKAGGEQDPATPQDGPKIVSLTPAVTQMLTDMGKRGLIVGISKEDDASLGLPVCGSYNDPIMARILELDPDLVITESGHPDGSDVPKSLRSYADDGLFRLAVIPHSRSIADVERALTSASGLGAAVEDAAAAERAQRLMSMRLELIHDTVASAKAPRVLMLIDPSTLGALGPGATHDEMLRLAGGVNAVAEFKTSYLKLSRSQVQTAARPDVVLIIEPNGVPIARDDTRLRALEGLAVPAVTHRRVVVIRHPKAMLPSTAVSAVVAEMAKAIHPDRAADIDRAYATAERVLDKAAAAGGGGS